MDEAVLRSMPEKVKNWLSPRRNDNIMERCAAPIDDTQAAQTSLVREVSIKTGCEVSYRTKVECTRDNYCSSNSNNNTSTSNRSNKNSKSSSGVCTM